MNLRAIFRNACAFIAALMLCSSAQAQVFRAYLASDGNDANPCNLAQPCRLLPAALAAVAIGGEIWMLDSANYNTGTVTIDKSVSILAVPGTVGSVIAIGGPAISISAASLTVALRNIVIVPLTGGGGTDGISMTGASTLSVEDCLIANLPLFGVHVTGSGTARITNTILRNNGGHGVKGEEGAKITVSGSQLLGNGNGGVGVSSNSATTTTAVVSDSIMSGGLFGVSALSNNAGASVRAFVTRCTIEATTYGFYVVTNGGVGSTLVTVSGSMITNNTDGWYISGAGAVLKSLANNHFTDNTTSVGSLTTASLQ